MVKISVIVAAYNAENYIEESIKSLLKQSYHDYEVIFIDDGSTDHTGQLIKKHVNRHTNFHLLENKTNAGLAISRNRGLLKAKGEYIAIHDADDVSLPDRFLIQNKFLDDNKDITVVGSTAIKINEKGEMIGYLSYPPETTEQSIWALKNWKLNPIIDPSSMYRLGIIKEFGGYNISYEYRLISDLDLWCRLLMGRINIHNIQHPLVKYRLNFNGLTISQEKEMKKSNEIVWSYLASNKFQNPVLNDDFYKQSCFTEYQKEN